MTLTEFINRACAYFDRAEKAEASTANPEQATKITQLEARVKELEGQVTERDATIKDLQGKLELAQGEVNAKGTEVKNLQASLEVEKKRVDETLAAMGVDPKTIPAAKGKESPGGQAANHGGDLLKQLNSLTDPVERTVFYRKHKAEIQAAWRPSKAE